MLLESPLNAFSYSMDKKLRNQTIYDYYDFIDKIPEENITMLFLADIKYRADSQLNVLIEHYGEQGSGKSLFEQFLALKIGEIYGLPFDMENNTVADFDQLDSVLHNSPFRSTFVVDEQPKSFVGFGSSTTLKSLKDYEEMGRYTMKNIIYIAPSEREHASYYVFKEDQHNSVERINNPACLNCHMQKECLKDFTQNRFNTLCGIPFYEKHGYPKKFHFLLLTRRKTDDLLMPRGYVGLPMLPPDLVQKYDSIKKRNIDIFEQKESLAWDTQRKQLEEFVKIYKPKLLFEDKKGEEKTQSLNVIKAYLFDHFGKRRYTTSEIGIMASLVKAELIEP